MTKTYIFSDGKKAIFEYDHDGVGKITLECMDMLMGQLIAYKWCIQSRSFWDGKHCDDCMFYDDCPFNPREDEDEPQKCDDCVWSVCNYNKVDWERTEQTEPMIYPQVDGITPSVIQKVGYATDSVTGEILGMTLDTDCAWK